MHVCHEEELQHVCYDFSDPRSWLAAPVDQEILDVLRLYPSTFCPGIADLALKMWPPPMDSEPLEEAIESKLGAAIRSHREAAGLPTRLDSHLAQLLHVALVNCECERRGLPSQAAVFEGLASRVCAPGEVLRATPVQFNHLRVSLFWSALSDRSSIREVLASPATTAFAVRARVVRQPEDAVAVWVLIAAKGKM
ncbi:cep76 [Symbiodinium sp. KB8]|nr:cep76 [Symbiodinium sp. KB8]